MASQTETLFVGDAFHHQTDNSSDDHLRVSTASSFPGEGHRISEGAAENGDALALAAASLRLERAGFEPPAAVWLPLVDRLRNPTDTPPALLPLSRAHEYSSTWTWLGDMERFELVKSCKRSRRPSPRKRSANDGSGGAGEVDGRRDRYAGVCSKTSISGGTVPPNQVACATADENRWCELNDAELAWVVGAHEIAEGFMARSRPAEACVVLSQLLDLSPSDVLAHVKLAVALLAADTEDGAGADFDSTSGGTGEEATKRGAERAPAANVQAARNLQIPVLLRCAVQLEPENAHLRSLVDLVLRIVGGVEVPDSYWGAELPRSPGIDLCLLAMLRR